MMDPDIEEAAARYTAAQKEGQSLIRSRWAALQSQTKEVLKASGLFSDRGERLDPDAASGNQSQDDCERLEYALGVLRQCVQSKLPLRTEKGAPIPREALGDDVLTSCEELLFVSAWHDPEFLRLGMHAVVVHQQANALSMIGPPSVVSAPVGCLGVVLKVGLMLLLPVALAAGIAAAVKQDIGASALAFYLAGAGILAAMSAAGLGVKKDSGFEQAHSAWAWFQLKREAGATGAGALENLRRMAADGVKVPTVAFDLADMLRSRMRAGNFSLPVSRIETGSDHEKRDAQHLR